MTGSTPSMVAGGSIAGNGPTDVSMSRQRPRAASCGCSANCWTVRIRALAMRAFSRRSTISGVSSSPKTASISASRAGRFASRSALAENRGSAASAGRRSTCSQNARHSRSFWMPRYTTSPSPPANGP